MSKDADTLVVSSNSQCLKRRPTMFPAALLTCLGIFCAPVASADLVDGLKIEHVFRDSDCKVNSRIVDPLSMGVNHELTVDGKRLGIGVGVYEDTEKATNRFETVLRSISASGESIAIGDTGFVWPNGNLRFRLKNVCISISAASTADAIQAGKVIEAFIKKQGRWENEVSIPKIAIALPEVVLRGSSVKLAIRITEEDARSFLFYLGPGLDWHLELPARDSITFTAPDKPGETKKQLLIASPRNVVVLKEIAFTVTE